MGRHGEQARVPFSSDIWGPDWAAGRLCHAEGKAGGGPTPLLGPLGGHFTSQGGEAHTSPSDKEVSCLKRLSDLNEVCEGHTLGSLSHRLLPGTLGETYTEFCK